MIVFTPLSVSCHCQPPLKSSRFVGFAILCCLKSPRIELIMIGSSPVSSSIIGVDTNSLLYSLNTRRMDIWVGVSLNGFVFVGLLKVAGVIVFFLGSPR